MRNVFICIQLILKSQRSNKTGKISHTPDYVYIENIQICRHWEDVFRSKLAFRKIDLIQKSLKFIDAHRLVRSYVINCKFVQGYGDELCSPFSFIFMN